MEKDVLEESAGAESVGIPGYIPGSKLPENRIPLVSATASFSSVLFPRYHPIKHILLEDEIYYLLFHSFLPALHRKVSPRFPRSSLQRIPIFNTCRVDFPVSNSPRSLIVPHNHLLLQSLQQLFQPDGSFPLCGLGLIPHGAQGFDAARVAGLDTADEAELEVEVAEEGGFF